MDKFTFYRNVGKERLRKCLTERATPCYIYFLGMIEKRLADLKMCLPDGFLINYAIKANPNGEILKHMVRLDVGADVASLGEMKAALRSGIPPERMEFSGPGKSEEEIRYAVLQGLSSINVESLPELRKIALMSRAARRVARVGLRLNPETKGLNAGMSMSGDSQFGIRQALLKKALEFLQSHSDALRFTGIHVHAGSQILSADAVLANFNRILDLALEIESFGTLGVEKINFGGGWGIKYFSNQKDLDLNRLRAGLKALFVKTEYRKFLEQGKLVLEPGRFLVGECGLYVTRVLYRKRGLKKNFLIVDGGMHHNYLLAGGMGQVIKRNFEMDIFCRRDRMQGKAKRYDIAGSLCTPQDILALDFEYNREIREGDFIVFFNSGAYGFSASPLHFLSRDFPYEFTAC